MYVLVFVYQFLLPKRLCCVSLAIYLLVGLSVNNIMQKLWVNVLGQNNWLDFCSDLEKWKELRYVPRTMFRFSMLCTELSKQPLDIAYKNLMCSLMQSNFAESTNTERLKMHKYHYRILLFYQTSNLLEVVLTVDFTDITIFAVKRNTGKIAHITQALQIHANPKIVRTMQTELSHFRWKL